MRQAYDYWQDQPGIGSSNACAQMHYITQLVLQTTFETNALAYSSNVNPHHISIVTFPIEQSMLQGLSAEIHIVPYTLLINPTTPNESVHRDHQQVH